MTPGAAAPYKEAMRRAPAAMILAAAAIAVAGCGGISATGEPMIPPGVHGPLFAGQVQVVAYSGGDVRICPEFAIATDLGPPQPPRCADGLRAVGVDTSALTSHAQGDRWGLLYLMGSYRHGVFSVQSQSSHGPAQQPTAPSLDKPPCATPAGGWQRRAPTQAQRSTVEHYSHLAHHRDLVDIAFFDHGSILTVASIDPARTRTVLGPHWPKQLCVVKARYSRATLIRVGARLERLLKEPTSATYGWSPGPAERACETTASRRRRSRSCSRHRSCARSWVGCPRVW